MSDGPTEVADPSDEQSRSVFVMGIPLQSTVEEVRTVFDPCGVITYVQTFRQTGRVMFR